MPLNLMIRIARMIFLLPTLMVMIALGTTKTLAAVVNMTVTPLMQLKLVAHAGEALSLLIGIR